MDKSLAKQVKLYNLNTKKQVKKDLSDGKACDVIIEINAFLEKNNVSGEEAYIELEPYSDYGDNYARATISATVDKSDEEILLEIEKAKAFEEKELERERRKLEELKAKFDKLDKDIKKKEKRTGK